MTIQQKKKKSRFELGVEYWVLYWHTSIGLDWRKDPYL